MAKVMRGYISARFLVSILSIFSLFIFISVMADDEMRPDVFYNVKLIPAAEMFLLNQLKSCLCTYKNYQLFLPQQQIILYIERQEKSPPA